MMSWRLVPSCGDVQPLIGTGGGGGTEGSRVDVGDMERTWDSPLRNCWAKWALLRVGQVVVERLLGVEGNFAWRMLHPV